MIITNHKAPYKNSTTKPSLPPVTFLTTGQAALFLQLSPVTLARWRVEGNGPPWVRLGRKSIRYARSDLESWAAGRRCTSTSVPGPDGATGAKR